MKPSRTDSTGQHQGGTSKRLPLKPGEKLAFNIEEPDFATTSQGGKPEMNKPFTGQVELGKTISKVERESVDSVRR
jgi:hypothetical protein